jgi:myosin protein heavy chain
VRNVDRTVKDLQLQIERREKANAQLQEDIARGRDKIEKLLKTIDDLQVSESEAGLAARRAERAAKEEAAKALRLEREVEGLKGMGMGLSKGKAGFGRSESVWSLASGGGMGHRRGESNGSVIGAGTGVEENGIEVPKRKSSITRKGSMSKGFL